jgi:hypothetical protein
MKSEVKTKFPDSDSQNFSLWASQDDRSKVRAACVGAVCFGAGSPAAVSADSLDRALR